MKAKKIIIAILIAISYGVSVAQNVGNDKITICHFPPGNPDNPQTITISKNALDAHLAHGDYVGECKFLVVIGYPNPYEDKINISYEIIKQYNVKIDVINVDGAIVQTLVDEPRAAGVYKVQFSAKAIGKSAGLYLVRASAKNATEYYERYIRIVEQL